jgi:hypothetical protein
MAYGSLSSRQLKELVPHPGSLSLLGFVSGRTRPMRYEPDEHEVPAEGTDKSGFGGIPTPSELEVLAGGVAGAIGGGNLRSAFAGAGAPLAVQLLVALRDRNRRRRVNLFDQTILEGTTLEVLLRRVGESQRLLDLLESARAAAAATSLEGKIVALANSVVRGTLVSDDAVDDRERRIKDTLAAIDCPDIRMLLWVDKVGQERDESNNLRPVMRSDLGELPWCNKALAESILALLLGEGLVEVGNKGGHEVNPSAWSLSGYGEEILNYLREVGDALREVSVDDDEP